MSSFCVFVKPTERRPRSTFVSLQRLGPAWQGPVLRLRDAEALGLRFPFVIGWSDFYGGTAAPVTVARATDGKRTGWLVWGGSQGLRALDDAADVGVGAVVGGEPRGAGTCPAAFDERPILWLSDVALLPEDVAAVVAPVKGPARSGPGGDASNAGEVQGERASGDRSATAR